MMSALNYRKGSMVLSKFVDHVFNPPPKLRLGGNKTEGSNTIIAT